MERNKIPEKLSTDEYCKVIIEEKTKCLDDFSVHQFISEGKQTLVIIDKINMQASVWQIMRNHLSPRGFSVTQRHSVKVYRLGERSNISESKL